MHVNELVRERERESETKVLVQNTQLSFDMFDILLLISRYCFVFVFACAYTAFSKGSFCQPFLLLIFLLLYTDFLIRFDSCGWFVLMWMKIARKFTCYEFFSNYLDENYCTKIDATKKWYFETKSIFFWCDYFKCQC